MKQYFRESLAYAQVDININATICDCVLNYVIYILIHYFSGPEDTQRNMTLDLAIHVLSYRKVWTELF